MTPYHHYTYQAKVITEPLKLAHMGGPSELYTNANRRSGETAYSWAGRVAAFFARNIGRAHHAGAERVARSSGTKAGLRYSVRLPASCSMSRMGSKTQNAPTVGRETAVAGTSRVHGDNGRTPEWRRWLGERHHDAMLSLQSLYQAVQRQQETL